MSWQDMTTRRDFIGKGLKLAGTAVAGPAILGRSSNLMAADAKRTPSDGRGLVVIELAGGNDGLNTVVPYRNDTYYKLRPTLAIKKSDVLRINDEVGLHPAAAGLKELYDQGLLTIVQGVGYPNASRSHMMSMDIWHKASPDPQRHVGWLGRYLDITCRDEKPDRKLGIAIANESPLALSGDRFEPLLVPDAGQLHDALADGGGRRASKPSRASGAAAYPRNALADSLRTIAELIAADLPTAVYHVTLSGFDTHAAQAARHRALLGQLGGSLAAFVKDLAAQGNLDRTLVMCFSEFGRCVEENAAGGTDHGHAGPMFLVGGRVKPGLVGNHPNLESGPEEDLAFTADFRSTYAGVLSNWLGIRPKAVLGQHFRPADVINA